MVPKLRVRELFGVHVSGRGAFQSPVEARPKGRVEVLEVLMRT